MCRVHLLRGVSPLLRSQILYNVCVCLFRKLFNEIQRNLIADFSECPQDALQSCITFQKVTTICIQC
jgi:hypothetical protein